jgi:hypothetical protein
VVDSQPNLNRGHNSRQFISNPLLVINQNVFVTEKLIGVTLEDFVLSAAN